MPSLCKVFTLQLHIFSLLLLYFCTFAFATLHPGIFALTAKVQVAPMEHHIAQKVYDRTVSVKLWREQEEVWAKFFPLYVKTRYWSFFFEKLPQTKLEWMCKRITYKLCVYPTEVLWIHSDNTCLLLYGDTELVSLRLW